MKIARYITLALAALIMPASAFASSIALTPTDVAPKVNQTFTLTITADPASAKAYTVRANISFDPALVQFVSFSYAPKWLVLSQTGYDTEDNTNGVLVKTAGYPGGFTSPTVLGTATFRAKAAGTSTIHVTTDSLILDSNGKNTVIGTQGATQVIAVTPVQAKTTTVTKSATKSTTKSASAVKHASTSAPKIASATSTDQATSTLATTSALAAAGAAGFSFGSLKGILLILLVLALVTGGAWYYRRQTN